MSAEAINTIPGWMTDTELAVIKRIGEDLWHDRHVLEIGSFFGRSAVQWAQSTNRKILCIDPWVGTLRDWTRNGEWPVENMGLQGDWAGINLDRPIYHQFIQNTFRYPNVYPIRENSAAITRFWHFSPSVIFIDGDHSPEGLYYDLDSAMNRWSDCGKAVEELRGPDDAAKLTFIMGHDYGNPGLTHIKPMVDDFAAANGFNVVVPTQTSIFILEPKAFPKSMTRRLRQNFRVEDIET